MPNEPKPRTYLKFKNEIIDTVESYHLYLRFGDIAVDKEGKTVNALASAEVTLSQPQAVTRIRVQQAKDGSLYIALD